MKIHTTIFFVLFLIINCANSLELSTGVIAKGRETIRTDEQAEASVNMTSLIKSQNEYHGRSYGYTNLGTGSKWFRLYRNLSISGVDLEASKYLGNWPLTPYSQAPFIAAEYLAGAERGSNMLGQEFERPQDANTVVQRETSYMLANYITGASDARGCFQAKPLRYGDVDADNINELVLFLGHQLVVFSPEQAKVVFSSYFWLTDEADEETKSNSYGELNNPEHPQFVASSGTDQLVDDLYPAWRSLTKLFDQDFNNNGKYDFVIWKKAYQSNLNSEAVGFHKIADVLMHYEKVDGVYQYNSDTSQSKMIGWLADNELTWSKGYPSVSECEGEEGQLIPEMHDALLNDPEVLK